jgi:hypothetical protein
MMLYSALPEYKISALRPLALEVGSGDKGAGGGLGSVKCIVYTRITHESASLPLFPYPLQLLHPTESILARIDSLLAALGWPVVRFAAGSPQSKRSKDAHRQPRLARHLPRPL